MYHNVSNMLDSRRIRPFPIATRRHLDDVGWPYDDQPRFGQSGRLSLDWESMSSAEIWDALNLHWLDMEDWEIDAIQDLAEEFEEEELAAMEGDKTARGWKEPSSAPDDGITRVLFVCTGNTSRSAIADALGRSLAAEGVGVASAGTWAYDGSPASAKATAATAGMNIDLKNHRSRAISPKILKAADRIFVMTRRHVGEILRRAPWAKNKVETLVPGEDISDPHGGDIKLYRKTAERVAAGVRDRMAEIAETHNQRKQQ